jgi:hypothetical protein
VSEAVKSALGDFVSRRVHERSGVCDTLSDRVKVPYVAEKERLLELVTSLEGDLDTVPSSVAESDGVVDPSDTEVDSDPEISPGLIVPVSVIVSVPIDSVRVSSAVPVSFVQVGRDTVASSVGDSLCVRCSVPDTDVVLVPPMDDVMEAVGFVTV